ncbi:MAG: NADH-quinone oxidoreductase subunit NuoK [Bacteroidota bacterium]
MNELPLTAYFYLASLLFSTGIYVVLVKKNAVFVLLGIELMLNGANLILVAFSKADPTLNGQIFAIFSVVLTVCEVSIALAVLLNIYRKHATSNLDELQEIGNE